MNGKQKLIFIGGAPGIGKSVTGDLLVQRLHDSIRVDGDELWCNMNPWRVDDITKAMVEKNIQGVLRNFLEAGFSYVILCWVLHVQGLIDKLVAGLSDLDFEFYSFTLVCDEATLKSRWDNDPTRGPITQLALERLAQTKELKNGKIDTTGITVDDAVEEILVPISDRYSHRGG